MANHRAASGAEVIGSQILVTVEALGIFKDTGARLLQQNGLANIQAEGWYPQQNYCDFLDTISTKIGPATMFIVGKNVALAASLPSDVNSLEKWAASATKVYQHNHRKVPMGEGWKLGPKTPNTLMMYCNEPYPDEFLRGLAAGFAQRLRPVTSTGAVSARFDDAKPRRDQGALEVSILIKW